MPSITEGSLRFDFPQGWDASKFDGWSFYRKQFMRIGEAEIVCKSCDNPLRCATCNSRRVAGSKGVDILAVATDSICWHVEVKDYRQTRATNFNFLADAVALKVRDTHACLVAARLNANEQGERDRAAKALRCGRLRVVLHLESPPTHNRLLPPATQRANVLQRLKQLVKAVDPRPLVVCIADMKNLPWTVTPV